jgi:hypothetical protein
MLYFDISMDNSLYEINKSMPEILKLLTYMPSSNKAHHVLTLINNLEKKHVMVSTKRAKMPLAHIFSNPLWQLPTAHYVVSHRRFRTRLT